MEEARRHVVAALAGKHPSIVFILGGGRNYIGSIISEQLPHACTVLLQPTAEFDGTEVQLPSLQWSPASARPLASVLAAALAGERLAGGVSLIEWPPVVTQFPESSGMIRSAVMAELQKASADAATSAFWSGRWLRNSLRFATSRVTLATIEPGNAPIIVACAGPGLADSLSDIHRYRQHVALWSLASAHAALSQAGLEPDLVIATDPGYWNGHHLYAAIRRRTPVAMPPSAFAPGLLFGASSIVPLDTGLSFERAALQTAGMSSHTAQASGSSAGTAIALALASTTGPVGVVGLDLAAHAMADHAVPYALDFVEAEHATRLQPSYSRRSARILDAYPGRDHHWRLSRTFTTYASTMAPGPADRYRTFRCSDSPVELPIRRSTMEQELALQSMAVPVHASIRGSGMCQTDAGSAAQAMLERLIADAREQAASAVTNGLPIPYEAALLFKALDPGHSAELLARAARAEADPEMLSAVLTASRLAAARLVDPAIPWSAS